MKHSDIRHIRIGDIIKLKDNLINGEFYDGFRCNDAMAENSGKEVTVYNIDHVGSRPCIILLDTFRYSMEMFVDKFRYGK